MSNHQNDDLHDPSEHDDDPHGNRPADGARQGTPGEVLSDNFTGSDTAGDFLGLDVDMDAMYAAGSEEEELALSKPNLDLREPTGMWNDEEREAIPTDDLAPGDVLAGDPTAFGATPQAAWDDDDHLSVEELDDEEYEEELEGVYEEASGGGGKKLALIAIPFVVGVLAVAGVVLVPRMLGKMSGESSVDVARNAPTPKTPKNAPALPKDVKNGTTAVTEPGLQNNEDPAEVEGDPDTVAEIDPLLDDGTGDPFQFEDDPMNEPLDGDPGTTRPGLDDLLGDLVGGTDTEDDPIGTEPSGDEALGGAAWSNSSSSEWDVIWKGGAVPMEAIASAQQVLTPRVGGVRVHMRSGEVFDGKLYAVGQNRVWLDARPGRVGLDGERVTKIDRLTEEDTVKSPGKKAATGDRVKIRVPGGHLFGRILSDDGEGHLTVETDAGGRVTIASAEAETIGRSRVRVLD